MEHLQNPYKYNLLHGFFSNDYNRLISLIIMHTYKFMKFFEGLNQNLFLVTLEMHFTFDIWAKNPSVTMKS